MLINEWQEGTTSATSANESERAVRLAQAPRRKHQRQHVRENDSAAGKGRTSGTQRDAASHWWRLFPRLPSVNGEVREQKRQKIDCGARHWPRTPTSNASSRGASRR